MNTLRLLCLLSIFTLLSGVPFGALAADKYGVGGDDYIVENGQPDLLDDEWGDDQDQIEISDPFESINRVAFEFNDKLYFWVLKPAKEGYSAVLPEDIRTSIGNFFYNLATPVNLANTLLQGRFEDSGVILGRFVINSTIGVFGFGDVAATEFEMQPKRGDFGETLGVYGFGEGVYICWPVFGPSNVRDSIGILGDMQLHPYSFAGFDAQAETAARGTEFINRLSITPDVYEEIKKISLDPYVATREAYVDYRRNLILSRDE